MRKIIAAFFFLFVCLPALGLEAASDPALAMVRIKSHGASATVIATADGKSWLLGCCHMIAAGNGGIDREALDRALKLDGPAQPHAKPEKAAARIIAYDVKLDLTLIELDNGPFHFIPVAPKGFKPGTNIRSLGYDSMKWPVTEKSATILKSDGDTTYTREKPWHGRSGGALVDVDARVLIGVVQGYELFPNDRGLYVSHDAIRRFLEKNWLPKNWPPKNWPPRAVPPPKHMQPEAQWLQPFRRPLHAAPGGC